LYQLVQGTRSERLDPAFSQSLSSPLLTFGPPPEQVLGPRPPADDRAVHNRNQDCHLRGYKEYMKIEKNVEIHFRVP
jgi:hypothetical protein